MKKLFYFVLALMICLPVAAQAVPPVQVELGLAVDVSGSVDGTEFALQRDGIKNAFLSVAADYANFNIQPFAASLIYWSTGQTVAVPWTIITNAGECTAFATAVGNALRPGSGTIGNLTGIGDAISFTANSILTNGISSNFLVIDVSGDGSRNTGAEPATTRDAALAAGISRINGLAIIDDEPNLLTYYQDNVIGGAGAFAIEATFATFAPAISGKITREVITPIPGSLLLLGTGLLSLVGFGFRKKN